jgi:hypothetical protein
MSALECGESGVELGLWAAECYRSETFDGCHVDRLNEKFTLNREREQIPFSRPASLHSL